MPRAPQHGGIFGGTLLSSGCQGDIKIASTGRIGKRDLDGRGVLLKAAGFEVLRLELFPMCLLLPVCGPGSALSDAMPACLLPYSLPWPAAVLPTMVMLEPYPSGTVSPK